MPKITSHHNDCFNVIKDIPNNSIDSIITDPPYGYLDHKLDAEFDYRELFREYKRVLKPNGSLVIFGRGVMLAKWIVYLDELGFKFKEELVWDKRRATSPFHALGRKHELAIVFGLGEFKINKVMIDYVEDCINQGEVDKIKNTIRRLFDGINNIKNWEGFLKWRNGEKKWVNGSSRHNITGALEAYSDQAWNSYQVLTKGATLKSIISVGRKHYDTIHPTQKPQELLERIVQLVTNEGDTILDTFGGSGTLGIACHKLNRDVILIEKDDEYYTESTKHIKDALGLFVNDLSLL